MHHELHLVTRSVEETKTNLDGPALLFRVRNPHAPQRGVLQMGSAAQRVLEQSMFLIGLSRYGVPGQEQRIQSGK